MRRRCAGVRMTLGNSQSGLSVGSGSVAVTSRPAPASRPSCRGGNERRLLDDAAARDGDQVGGGLHQRQATGVNQPDSLRCAGGADGEVVADLHEVVEAVQAPDLLDAGSLRGRVEVHRHDPHAEAGPARAISPPILPRPTMPSVASLSSNSSARDCGRTTLWLAGPP